ncbi:tRNA pseudouridine(55) synthase TruB [Bombilactobacillus folatiphilus]|uniref:tRNA pseudouridine synthase B n=1 Tax=Bombilactobacillus folatiphilus TaxID=2923362 RepID=A0ABY4P7L7_9LACO|nr:tRNA pseudouridine(55) synthase TruB [Bombilactobacillus folatiphilus]UQS81580.1 tRNA pseudouridine(55) synthase TruB [Bombilactobacillus folatiphilus]
MNGIIPLYKPRGMTSADCVYQLRKLLHEKKIGHTGTLDPEVDGVLTICVGQATKLVNWLLDSDKVYQGQVVLGKATSTEDATGEIIDQKEILTPFTIEQVEAAMLSLTGSIQQTPPMYSAVKVNGKRLYEYARAGQIVQRPSRQVTIKKFQMRGVPHFDEHQHLQMLDFTVVCSKGTYIRTLAVQLGESLNVPAYMSRLTRTAGSSFTLDQTVSFDQISAKLQQNEFDFCLPLEAAFSSQIPRCTLTDEQWQQVQNGSKITLAASSKQVLLTFNGIAKALYQKQADFYVPQIMLLKNDR